jgi:hypothetical protein
MDAGADIVADMVVVSVVLMSEWVSRLDPPYALVSNLLY